MFTYDTASLGFEPTVTVSRAEPFKHYTTAHCLYSKDDELIFRGCSNQTIKTNVDPNDRNDDDNDDVFAASVPPPPPPPTLPPPGKFPYRDFSFCEIQFPENSLDSITSSQS